MVRYRFLRTMICQAIWTVARECKFVSSLQWRHSERDGVSNHQPHDCLLNRFFRRRSKKTSKLRVTSLCVGNSSVTGEFPAHRASNAENVSIWWRLHENLRAQSISWSSTIWKLLTIRLIYRQYKDAIVLITLRNFLLVLCYTIQ